MAQHSELTKNHRFQVYIGNHKLAFSKISGLSSSMEKEVYTEGGGINYPHIMQKPNGQLRSITMERGLQASNNIIKNLAPGIHIPSIQIIVLGTDGKPYYEFFLEEAWVTRWEVSELDAMGGRMMIDTFEVEYVNLKKEILR